MSPLKGAILLPNYEPDQSIFSWSRRWSSCAWSRMYLRTISSSKPTVDTKYPRAQKLSPVKLRLRPRKFRATEIALLPLMWAEPWPAEIHLATHNSHPSGMLVDNGGFNLLCDPR